MSLTSIAWKYVGSALFVTPTVAAVLDALYTLGTATTYADGSGRTEGAGSAWTWTGNRYQNAGTTEACYPVPPLSTLGLRVLLAGSSSTPSPSPTMASPDTYAVNNLLVNLTRSAGAFASWNAAAPFTSGTTFGHWKTWPTTAGVGTVYLWEGTEGIAVLVATATGTTYGAILGAVVDPESTESVDAESDGKLYGILTSNSTVINAAFRSTNGAFLGHNAGNGVNHAAVLAPAGSSLLTMHCSIENTAMTTTGMKSRSGRFARASLRVRASAAAPDDNFLGRLREIVAFGDGITPNKLSNAGTTIGWVFGASTITAQDAVLLEA